MFGLKLKKKQAISIRDAIEQIANKAHTYPKIIQSDNGSEFKAAFSEWTKEHNIDHIKN
jgi:transposase InsO family protein